MAMEASKSLDSKRRSSQDCLDEEEEGEAEEVDVDNNDDDIGGSGDDGDDDEGDDKLSLSLITEGQSEDSPPVSSAGTLSFPSQTPNTPASSSSWIVPVFTISMWIDSFSVSQGEVGKTVC